MMRNNQNYESLFRDYNKEKAFDELAELFFDGNFSSTSKSEIELIMFHYYMDALITKYKKESGVLDYSKCSDYEIAKQLGVTRERVRTLKVKAQARYPVKYDWKESLVSLKENVRYDERKGKIIIPVPDPNLYNEIRNFIEENGGYVEVQRSENYIQIRPEYYIILIHDSSDKTEREKIYKETMKQLNKKNPSTPISIESKMDMVNHILGIAENGLGILASLIGITNSPLTFAISGLKSTFLRIAEGTQKMSKL